MVNYEYAGWKWMVEIQKFVLKPKAFIRHENEKYVVWMTGIDFMILETILS